MPSKSPPIDALVAERLSVLGERIRQHRKLQRVSATAVSEAAGMSRLTLARIERGTPSVTIGAWLGALSALGLDIELVDPSRAAVGTGETAGLPARIRLADYPALKRLAWQLDGIDDLAPADALSLYERNWRHVDVEALDDHERALVRRLAAALGGGRLLV
jgi:transcriptional regulator with XRE-family HTH domain